MFDLEEINYRTVKDPKGFCEECEAEYAHKIDVATDKIIKNLKQSPIVLLAGPSGSGKTTTSIKISEALEKKGVHMHYVAMDDYFTTVSDETTPKTADGAYDLESPLCLDIDLLNKHFDKLQKGEKIVVPKYDFKAQARSVVPSKAIKLKADEAVVFEGIHALNDMITEKHPEAFRLYVSAQSDIMFRDVIVFKRTWFRLVRRMVRDYNFRGASSEKTMSMWNNVRRGEKLYISPFKAKADAQINTSMECELAVMNETATKLFSQVPEGIERYEELKQVYPAIQLFGEIDNEFVANDSLLREFIGGGIYDY